MSDLEPLSPPRMFTVRQDLDQVRVQLPRRVTSDRRQHTFFILGVLGCVLAASLGGCFMGPLMDVFLQGSRWMFVVPLLVLFLSFLPYLALIFGHRLISSAGEVVLSQRTLTLHSSNRPTIEIPLESVRDITIIAAQDRGRLRFSTVNGELDLFDGLFRNELEWLQALVQQHTQRQRQALTAAGHDVDAIPAVPAALHDIVRRTT